ncbi:hypothetical protein [Halolactibacillus sp. JCM 19043]|nr:hypothetical protein [Halolactibacillus sp. JCM 19043]
MNDQLEKEIVNFLIEKIRENQVSQKELDETIELIKKLYYTDAIIK